MGVVLSLLLSLTSSNELSEQNAPTLGVWYHAFYSLDPANLSTGGWKTVKKWKHPLPVGGTYDCEDEKTIERQVMAMRDVGVRFIVFDHTNTVHVDNGQIDRRIRKWYDWMDKQPEEKRLLLTIAAGGELNQHSNRDGWKEASSFLWENYASRPSHARLHGKPLLCWYIEKDVWDDWVDDRWTIRRTYHFFRTPDQGKHEGWGWGSNPEPPPNAECMCVMPGWHRGDDKGGGVPRLAGQHYTKGWLAILKARPRYILIGSWNEWGELTAIENSLGWEDRRGQSCPDYYTKMTKGYLAAAEGLLLDDCYYQVEGEPSIRKWTGSSWRPQAQAPSRHPVIVLPREWKPRQ